MPHAALQAAVSSLGPDARVPGRGSAPGRSVEGRALGGLSHASQQPGCCGLGPASGGLGGGYWGSQPAAGPR
eukprot:14028522-Heterocapsa_arctica.AAC.1